MICPKCHSQNAQPTMSWTISGRKLTVPQLSLWACLNRECRYQWPRESTSPLAGLASLPRPDLLSQEVAYESSTG